MKQMNYRLPFGVILMTGLVIGVVRGQEVKQKWLIKMKSRQDEKRFFDRNFASGKGEVMLDEIELATYHR